MYNMLESLQDMISYPLVTKASFVYISVKKFGSVENITQRGISCMLKPSYMYIAINYKKENANCLKNQNDYKNQNHLIINVTMKQ